MLLYNLEKTKASTTVSLESVTEPIAIPLILNDKSYYKQLVFVCLKREIRTKDISRSIEKKETLV